MGILVDLLKEAHKHPFYNLILGLALLFYIPFSLEKFAYADETEKNISENTKILTAIKIGMEKNSLENEIRYMESEMFGLESAVEAGDATNREIARLSNLRSDFGRVKRELESIYSLQSSL